MNEIVFVVQSIILFIPALIANSGAVITGGHFVIDRGRKFIDGRRILGNGKTLSGYAGGIAIGTFTGFIIYLISGIFNYALGTYGTPADAIVIPFIMATGSLTGDIAGSFVKRRIGIDRGGKGGLLDQWPFALMAFLFLYAFERPFFMDHYFYVTMIVILVIVPPIHRAVNIIGYRMHKKDVPW
ncbi:MAG: CDP-2,3-bis-(O-geranylgeranyl)-sn-glycerol synthase [Thermoplasma acidophilum]|nr:CDP-2,3-bis-(O-geranylgeranyl)-sn-glycerol synthase [Thermoplasma acidophilum]